MLVMLVKELNDEELTKSINQIQNIIMNDNNKGKLVKEYGEKAYNDFQALKILEIVKKDLINN